MGIQLVTGMNFNETDADFAALCPELANLPKEELFKKLQELQEVETVEESSVPTEFIDLQIRHHMAELGLYPSCEMDIVMDGFEHFYEVKGDREGRKSGVYRVDLKSEPVTWFVQDWRTGVKSHRDFAVDFDYKDCEILKKQEDKNDKDDDDWGHERRLKYFEELGIPAPFQKSPNAKKDVALAQDFIYESCGNYKFVPHDGFYIYSKNKGIWEKVADEVMKKHIIVKLGADLTSRSINGVFNVLSYFLCIEHGMNPYNKLVLKNGTLNLETFELEKHSKRNYATISVDYEYDPDATCPNWENFIADVANDDKRRILVLQEVAGYLFCEKNPVQAAVFLLGHGANGKSIYLKVLQELIGKHYTTVNISALDQPFQVIRLEHAWADISSELKADNPSSEAAFKALVGGDEMVGCWKHKDFKTIHPRAKVLMACNEMIKWQEQSWAMLRRMAYVKFTKTYTDEAPNPKAINQKQADAHIIDRLLPELPGILNWAIEGYKRLMAKKKPAFTKTKDYYEVLRQNKMSGNAVFAFLAEFRKELEGTTPHRVNLFTTFQNWAKNTGQGTKMGRGGFYDRLREIFSREMGITLEEVKINGRDCFKFPHDFFFLDEEELEKLEKEEELNMNERRLQRDTENSQIEEYKAKKYKIRDQMREKWAEEMAAIEDAEERKQRIYEGFHEPDEFFEMFPDEKMRIFMPKDEYEEYLHELVRTEVIKDGVYNILNT